MPLVGIFEGTFFNRFHFQIQYGFDSAYDYTIPARGRLIAQTDIQIAVPTGCYGRVGKNFLSNSKIIR